MTGAGRRTDVLITRPHDDTRTAELVRARGYRPVWAPLLTVRHRKVTVPAGTQALLLTSGNALPALQPAPDLPVFAVGDATAARARQAGFTDVRSAAGDAAALARLVAGAALPARGPLLLVCGAGQGATLAAALRAAGFSVLRRVAYAARPAARLPEAALAAVQGGDLHAALFLSAETAATFVRLLPPDAHASLRQVAAVAIGPAASRVLEALPWQRVSCAPTPTLDDVVALL